MTGFQRVIIPLECVSHGSTYISSSCIAINIIYNIIIFLIINITLYNHLKQSTFRNRLGKEADDREAYLFLMKENTKYRDRKGEQTCMSLMVSLLVGCIQLQNNKLTGSLKDNLKKSRERESYERIKKVLPMVYFDTFLIVSVCSASYFPNT